MSNIVSYIMWRGDLSIEEKPFNEVDNLVFAVLSYFDFSGIVPTIEEKGFVTLQEAYRLILTKKQGKTEIEVHGMLDLPPSFLEKIAYSKRFGNVKLFNYKDECDKNLQMQFAALHIELEDETVYVAFRGTDETILGWREDFAMSFETVPAQHEAVRYLEQTMTASHKKYRIGGHSKGGNLAVYASAMCKDALKNQIIEIYNNDGPGFSKEILETQKYKEIGDKIIRIIPQFSIIGMLFEHYELCKIVKSSASGIMQHDAMTWEVEGDHFLEMEELMPECKVINGIFDTWLEDVNIEQRRIFTKNFFDALEAGGAKKLSDVASGGIQGFESILINMVGSERESKTVLYKLIKSIANSFHQINFIKLLKTKNTIIGACIALLGLFFMMLPEHALQIISRVIVFIIVVFAVKRLTCLITRKVDNQIMNRYVKNVYILIISFVILFSMQKNAFVFSTNFSLGAILIGSGIVKLNAAAKGLDKNQKLWWMSWVRAFMSITLGVVELVTLNRVAKINVFVIGAFMIIEGLWQVVNEMGKCRNV